MQSRSYEDKEGQKKYVTEVVCDDLVLLGGRGDSAGGSGGEFAQPASMPRTASAPRPQPTPAAAPDDFGQGITDDDVPF